MATAAAPPSGLTRDYLAAQGDLLASVVRMQDHFLRDEDAETIFRDVLGDLLAISDSRFGFVAERLDTDPSPVAIQILAYNSAAVAAADTAFFARHWRQGVRLRNPHSLYGEAVRTRAALISNDAENDPRRSGVPPGHPQLKKFLGIPLMLTGKVMGMVALGNAPQGYDEAVLARLLPLVNGVQAVLGAWRTAQARRHAERVLAEREQQLQLAIDGGDLGLWEVDFDSGSFRADARWAATLGLQPAELPATLASFYAYVDPQQHAAVQAAFDRCRHGRSDRIDIETRLRHRSGDWVWVLCKGKAIEPLAHGGNRRATGTLMDIGPRKQGEEAIVAAQAAERANLAKSEFLSRMSHELRTPLNAMLGFAQLLQIDPSEPLATVQAERVNRILHAGRHLLAMINDVLDLSRIEAGSLAMSIEALSLARVVEDSLAMMAPLAAQMQVQLAIDGRIDPALRARGDNVRLRQMLVNLLSNGIKYNRRGGSVRVRCEERADEVRLSVLDTGIGMTPEQQAHLFEPFNRLGAEGSAVEGVGIGLVIVRRLADLMGARIEVDSQAGEGSVFTLRLEKALAPPTAELEHTTGSASSTAMTVPARRVLYIEDNALNIEVVVQMLRQRPGWQLSVARNGAEALTLLEHSRPDLMLIDIHLGDTNGIALRRRIAALPGLAQVPCIAVSADAMATQIRAAKDAGFVDYIVKPIDVAAFLATLDLHLAAPPSHNSNAA